jgi:hypothetical protein
MFARTDTARGIQAIYRRFSRDPLLGPDEEPPLACHLVTPRTLYNHHGIYVGNGRVIHYAGLAHGLRRGPVEDVSLERFARGRGIRIRHDARRFDCHEVVERARSRLGERRYRILTNNCKHFCAWALRDHDRSIQVDRLRIFLQAMSQGIRSQYQRIDRHHSALARALHWWDPSPLARCGSTTSLSIKEPA